MTFQLIKRLSIEIQISLRRCVIEFFSELGIVDKSFTFFIEIVHKILYLPRLKYTECFNVLFELSSRNITIFVFIKLVEDVFSFRIIFHTS